MRITSYSFGSITVDDTRYTKDILILPDRIESPWWRKNGHSLVPADLTEIFSSQSEELIIGTGRFGFLKIPATTVDFFQTKGIRLVHMPTMKAVQFYNSQWEKGVRSTAGFHLTC